MIKAEFSYMLIVESDTKNGGFAKGNILQEVKSFYEVGNEHLWNIQSSYSLGESCKVHDV